jgi:membrane protein
VARACGKFQSLNKASLVLVGVVTLGIAVSILVGKLRSYSFIAGIFGMLLTALIPFGIWILVSWYLPNRATRWEDVVPGAALFGVGVLVLHFVTVYWIAHEVESKTDTYGAIGSALAILLWAYLLGRLMAAGAVLNMALWEQRHQDQTPAPEATG